MSTTFYVQFVAIHLPNDITAVLVVCVASSESHETFVFYMLTHILHVCCFICVYMLTLGTVRSKVVAGSMVDRVCSSNIKGQSPVIGAPLLNHVLYGNHLLDPSSSAVSFMMICSDKSVLPPFSNVLTLFHRSECRTTFLPFA